MLARSQIPWASFLYMMSHCRELEMAFSQHNPEMRNRGVTSGIEHLSDGGDLDFSLHSGSSLACSNSRALSMPDLDRWLLLSQ